jgi:hypothetical protein
VTPSVFNSEDQGFESRPGDYINMELMEIKLDENHKFLTVEARIFWICMEVITGNNIVHLSGICKPYQLLEL